MCRNLEGDYFSSEGSLKGAAENMAREEVQVFREVVGTPITCVCEDHPCRARAGVLQGGWGWWGGGLCMDTFLGSMDLSACTSSLLWSDSRACQLPKRVTVFSSPL